MAHLRRSFVALASAFAASALTLWACSFPEIRIAGETGGSGGASTSSSTTGGSGGAATTSSSSTSSSTSSSSSGTGGGSCTTDDDHDLVVSWACDPLDAAKDCADGDGRAHPGAGFQGSAIVGDVKGGTTSFDFNCDGAEDAETQVLACPGLATGCPAGEGFEASVLCGKSGALGHCVPSGIVCAWAPLNPAKMVVQRCK